MDELDFLAKTDRIRHALLLGQLTPIDTDKFTIAVLDGCQVPTFFNECMIFVRPVITRSEEVNMLSQVISLAEIEQLGA